MLHLLHYSHVPHLFASFCAGLPMCSLCSRHYRLFLLAVFLPVQQKARLMHVLNKIVD